MLVLLAVLFSSALALLMAGAALSLLEIAIRPPDFQREHRLATFRAFRFPGRKRPQDQRPADTAQQMQYPQMPDLARVAAALAEPAVNQPHHVAGDPSCAAVEVLEIRA